MESGWSSNIVSYIMLFGLLVYSIRYLCKYLKFYYYFGFKPFSQYPEVQKAKQRLINDQLNAVIGRLPKENGPTLQACKKELITIYHLARCFNFEVPNRTNFKNLISHY